MSGLGEFLRVALVIAAKDLRVEARAREIVYAMVFFAALVVLLFAFAFTKEGQSDRQAVAGALWIAVALTGTMGLGRATDREREGGTFRALLLAPIDRNAIFVGKLVGITCFMLLSELVAVPLLSLFFRVSFTDGGQLLPLLVLLGLGTLGFASVGSLFAAMLSRARGRDVLLGLLLYPVVIPVLLAGTRGTQALLSIPVDTGEAWFWARLLLATDAVFFVVAMWLYEPLVATE